MVNLIKSCADTAVSSVTDQFNLAYQLACQEDTVEVFDACLNLVGHCGAGKTSLATRLMDKEFNPDVQNTEGISIHLVKSIFKKNEQKMAKWDETYLDSSSYIKDFSRAVLTRLKSTKLRRRRATPNQMVAAKSAKRSSNTESGHDVEKSEDKTSQQAIKPQEESSEMSNSEVNSDEQINTINTQDQTKPCTDKNGVDRQRQR